MPTLQPHPRLFVTAEQLENAARAEEPLSPFLAEARQAVLEDAESFLAVEPLGLVDGHNAHLVRARHAQNRILTLLFCWKLTGREDYRRAALEYVRQIEKWEYWSWIAWRKNDAAADAIYDLSYGENSATLALAYDWLRDSLSAQEQELFLNAAQRAFVSGQRWCKPGETFWYGKKDSNWNTVCAGGLGMLCLAMYEDTPVAPELLELADQSIRPFMESLKETDGGWPEGIGYWNYGMCYGFMYLLSHEKAFRTGHPLMNIPEVRRTLQFPLDFSPYGIGCSFGDGNSWEPHPIHFAAAQRVKAKDVTRALEHRIKSGTKSARGWKAAQWLLFYTQPEHAAGNADGAAVTRLYQGLDWAVMADQMPEPEMYVSIRGGTTNVPHGQLDLLSFHCVIGGERFITNSPSGPYLDTTFSRRRNDIFEMRPDSKSTVFVDGVGIAAGSSLDRTELLDVEELQAVRLNASSAFGKSRDGSLVREGLRLIMLLGKGALIVDRIILPHNGRTEIRFHTEQTATVSDHRAQLRGQRQDVQMVCAGNVPSVLCTAAGAPTQPSVKPLTMLRWCSETLHKDFLSAVLLWPGEDIPSLALEPGEAYWDLRVAAADFRQFVRLTDELNVEGIKAE